MYICKIDDNIDSMLQIRYKWLLSWIYLEENVIIFRNCFNFATFRYLFHECIAKYVGHVNHIFFPSILAKNFCPYSSRGSRDAVWRYHNRNMINWFIELAFFSMFCFDLKKIHNFIFCIKENEHSDQINSKWTLNLENFQQHPYLGNLDFGLNVNTPLCIQWYHNSKTTRVSTN